MLLRLSCSLLALTASVASAELITLLTWNVESDRPDADTNDPAVIKLRTFSR